MPSTASAPAAPIAQSAAAAIQTPLGDTARPSSSEGGAEREADLPRERVQGHVAAHQARLGEVRRERPRDGAVQALADREDDHDDDEDAEGAVSGGAAPANGTTSHAPAQSRPKSASVGIRRRPRASRAIGSCANTMTRC